MTNTQEWLSSVDSLVGGTGYLTAVDDLLGPVASVAYCDDGNMLVVGVSDPSGVVLADHASYPLLYEACRRLGTELTYLADDLGRRGVLIKTSAMVRGGVRGINAAQAIAFDEVGFEQVQRSFYVASPDTYPMNVSSRTKTQINAAARKFQGADVLGDREWEMLLELYLSHSDAKGTTVAFNMDNVKELTRRKDSLISGRLYFPRGSESHAVGYSICIGDPNGIAAEIFTWGSLDSMAIKGHVTKLIVSDSIEALFRRGYRLVEYGCRFDGPRYGGLTEFYRRLGGREVPGVWIFKGLDVTGQFKR